MIKIKKHFKTVGLCLAGILLITQLAQADEKEKSTVSLSALSSIKFFKQKLQCLGCDMKNVNFSYYDPSSLIQTPNSMKNCVMDITLSGSDLSEVEMDKAKFIACGRAGTPTPFRKIDFSNVNLNHANLSHSVFYAVTFRGADLSHANLTHTQFSLSDFSNANLTEANLSHAQSQRDAMQGWGANFSQANFSKADLNNASLYGYFQGANFTGANLKNTVLNSTLDTVPPRIKNIKSADLWKGVNFTDADLEGAHILSDDDSSDIEKAKKANLSQAIFCRTKLPDGSSSNRDC